MGRNGEWRQYASYLCVKSTWDDLEVKSASHKREAAPREILMGSQRKGM